MHQHAQLSTFNLKYFSAFLQQSFLFNGSQSAVSLHPVLYMDMVHRTSSVLSYSSVYLFTLNTLLSNHKLK